MDQSRTGFDPARLDALKRKIDRPIVLVGMMGVGKSSVGKRLATLLGLEFADADDEIEEAARLTIPEIFEVHGEAYFRDGERRVIARLLEDGRAARVIATGGGAFCNSETRSDILGKSVAVWLDSDIDTLVERTSRKDNRPLLKDGNPREILTRLRDERRAAYAQAPVCVTSKAGPHQATVDKVLEAIDAWL